MGRKGMKFNIIDALILIILLVAAAVLIYIFVISDNTKSEDDFHNVEYVVEASSLNSVFRDAVSEGDPVLLSTNRKQIGTVTKAPEIKQSIKTGFDYEKNEETYTTSEDLIDITITFNAKAEKTEWGYEVEEVYLLVNDSIRLFFGDTQCVVNCIKMTVLD